MVVIKKYRYSFSKEFLIELDNFSHGHIDDNRNIFNDAWSKWMIDNSVIVENEKKILLDMGYIGDIAEKMYHHARFSLRKKRVKDIKKKGDIKIGEVIFDSEYETKKKRKSCKISLTISERKEWLKKIVSHIETIIENNRSISPSHAFAEFSYMIDNYDLFDYLKKSYKNKYYLLVQ